MRSLIIGFIGEDRPGIVQSLTEIVTRHGGSWQESKMVGLSGHFSGAARIEIDESDLSALKIALEQLSHLSVIVRDPVEHVDDAVYKVMRLNINGPDRPGILRDVSSELSKSNINVLEMDTEIVPAPMTGAPTFVADAEVHVPYGVDLTMLVETLNDTADRLGIDILLEEMNLDQ
jgi:glycine cleavage system regulatory protein